MSTHLATSHSTTALDLSDGRVLAPGASAEVDPGEHERHLQAAGLLHLRRNRGDDDDTKREAS